MTNSEVLNELITLFQTELEDDSIMLEFNTTANDVDNWDSLNHMALISAIEKLFKVKFSLKEIMKLKNVGDMCSLLESKTSN